MEDEIKATEELLRMTDDLIETEVETLAEVMDEPTEIVEKKEVVKKPKRKRKHVFLAMYTGTAKDIRLSGVGRIHPGKEFEVSEKIANTLKLDENFKVRTTYTYIEV